jgi:hypothetical protein
MMLNEQDKFIQHIIANRDAEMAATAGSMTQTETSEGTVVEREVDESDFVQWVNSMPPLSSYNRFACLEVDTIIEPHICIANSTEVVQTPSHPPIPNRRSRIPAWERWLPIKYVVAASPGPMSLVVDAKIESTDTAVTMHTGPY